MPWRCPACQIPIRHNELGDHPRLGHRYRCHVCRLELVVDPDTERLTVAPIRDDNGDSGDDKNKIRIVS